MSSAVVPSQPTGSIDSAFPPVQNSRTIYLGSSRPDEDTGIDFLTAQRVTTTLATMDSQDDSPILMVLHTPGGDIDAGLCIVNAMRMCRSPIIGLVMGECCSMGACIFLHCDVRLMGPQSFIMFHQMIATSKINSVKNIKSQDEIFSRYDKLMPDWVAKLAKLSKEQTKIFMERDLYLNAEEAIAAGVADTIATSWTGIFNLMSEHVKIPKRKELRVKRTTKNCKVPEPTRTRSRSGRTRNLEGQAVRKSNSSSTPDSGVPVSRRRTRSQVPLCAADNPNT